MATVPVYVGLDYHTRSVQVCVVSQSGSILVNRRCGNSVAEIAGALPPGVSVERAAIANRWVRWLYHQVKNVKQGALAAA